MEYVESDIFSSYFLQMDEKMQNTKSFLVNPFHKIRNNVLLIVVPRNHVCLFPCFFFKDSFVEINLLLLGNQNASMVRITNTDK